MHDDLPRVMSHSGPPPLSGTPDPADNQTLCAEISLLFTFHLNGLTDAIARIGGNRLADQFEQQLNDYAIKHAWSSLTGMNGLADLRQRVPDVDASMLLSVYLSYAKYARLLAKRILGTQLLKSTENALVRCLPPRLATLNAKHQIIPQW